MKPVAPTGAHVGVPKSVTTYVPETGVALAEAGAPRTSASAPSVNAATRMAHGVRITVSPSRDRSIGEIVAHATIEFKSRFYGWYCWSSSTAVSVRTTIQNAACGSNSARLFGG